MMAAHRCCDCKFTPAAACAELVAGDPADPCNWWPEAYEVSVTLSGVSYRRQFNDFANTGNASIDCDTGNLVPDGLIWCRTINWSWSLSTTIYRVRAAQGAFGTLGLRCPDVGFPDDGFNVEGVEQTCLSADANSDCGPTPFPAGSVPSYSSPCCCDSAATLTGIADRTFFSAARQNNLNTFPFGSPPDFCQLNAGTTEDSIAFTRKCRVSGDCRLGLVRTKPDGPAWQTKPDGTVRFQISVSAALLDPDGACDDFGALAWWPTQSSLIIPSPPFGSACAGWPPGAPPRCDQFNIFGSTTSTGFGTGFIQASSQPLVVAQPGVVGSMGVGDAFGMPLVYEHECGPEGGCDATTVVFPYLEMPGGTGVTNYACTQLSVTVTPVEGSA